MSSWKEEFTPVDDSSVSIELHGDSKETATIHVVFPAYLLAKPRKPLAPREMNKDSGVYEIPANETFVASRKRLASGHRFQLTVIREAKPEARQAVFAQAVEDGLRVVPVESKVKQFKRAVDESGATDGAVSASTSPAPAPAPKIHRLA
jgi:hypothetical protein